MKKSLSLIVLSLAFLTGCAGGESQSGTVSGVVTAADYFRQNDNRTAVVITFADGRKTRLQAVDHNAVTIHVGKSNTINYDRFGCITNASTN